LISTLQEPFSLDSFNQIILDSGFPIWGITNAKIHENDKLNILSWVENKLHGDMQWFEKNMELRLDFKNLGFKPESIFVFLVPYPDETPEEFPYLFSRYALGRDYHTAIREKIQPILQYLKNHFPDAKFRHSVDSLPIPEKILGRDAGLGWIGNNTLLINKEIGSYFFITTILSSIFFEPSTPKVSTNHCGSCRKCMDACPTNALIAPAQIDSNLCISHNTIESKKENFKEGHNHGWLFGCDICQEVCPWNRKARRKYRKSESYKPWTDWKPIPFFQNSKEEIELMNHKEFTQTFQDSAVSRIKYSQFRRNLKSL
jgi:epoxyqueuosine reductase